MLYKRHSLSQLELKLDQGGEERKAGSLQRQAILRADGRQDGLPDARSRVLPALLRRDRSIVCCLVVSGSGSQLESLGSWKREVMNQHISDLSGHRGSYFLHLSRLATGAEGATRYLHPYLIPFQTLCPLVDW